MRERPAGKQQSECNLAGSDEVVEMGKIAGRQRPMLIRDRQTTGVG